MMANNEIIKLNKTYNKLFLQATYNLLKEKDLQEGNYVEDPLAKKKVKINRSLDFLSLWIKYFRELAPILTHISSTKERNEIINLIYGQSIKSVLGLWYHWPSIKEVAMNTVKRDLEKQIKHIKKKGTYEII